MASASIWVTVALVTVQVLFGINYVVSKYLVGQFPPLVWAGIRIVSSSLVLIVILWMFYWKKAPKITKAFLLQALFLTLVGTVLNQACFLIGLQYTTSTNGAIICTLIPVFTLLIVTLRGQEQLTKSRALGFLSAFIGVLLLQKIENFSLSEKTFLGDFLILVNAFCFGIFLAYGKSFMEQHDRTWATFWLFFLGSFGLNFIAIPDWMHFHMPALTWILWGAILYGIIGGNLLTYFLQNWALARARSSHVALFIYVQPVIAAFLGWLWLGEQVTTRILGASLLVFLGVFLSVKKAKKKTSTILVGTSS